MGNNFEVIVRLAHRDIDVSNRPYRDYLDMKVVYNIRVDEGYAVVTNEMMEGLGLTEEDLYDMGITRIKREEHPRVDGLGDLINSIAPNMDVPETPGTYVLTSKTAPFGAAMVLVPEAVDTLEQIFHGEFYAIPSSIHEFILMDKSMVDDVEVMNQMIQEINEAVVMPEDVLSDHLYTSTELKEGLETFRKAS